MDNFKFDHKLKEIEHKYIMKKNALYKEYALSNNTVKIDDIITDHIGLIKVGSIGFYLSAGRTPLCIYRGHQYTKQGKPFKNESIRSVYQENIIPQKLT